MAVDVTVPSVGESITEVFVGTWLKQPGERVGKDEPLVEIETDKATLEVPSPVDGVLAEQLAAAGGALNVGDVIARIDTEGAAAAGTKDAAPGRTRRQRRTPRGGVPARTPRGATAADRRRTLATPR